MRPLIAVAALLFSLGPAMAQDYPNKPITIVVPAAAGGPTDTISRVTERWRRRRHAGHRPRRARDP
jgi:tripartite-type tricarboxylate transporter receptor subunit TctC